MPKSYLRYIGRNMDITNYALQAFDAEVSNLRAPAPRIPSAPRLTVSRPARTQWKHRHNIPDEPTSPHISDYLMSLDVPPSALPRLIKLVNGFRDYTGRFPTITEFENLNERALERMKNANNSK